MFKSNRWIEFVFVLLILVFILVGWIFFGRHLVDMSTIKFVYQDF